ncbi:organic cation transporter protein-like [Bacillus rossius redtenbacheri]|uniref:organic cation transporter protein-like n=1 Tax=Bacillus rossius redtenbacheri TaxID=93214 RepID=UPI002FDCED37
MHGTSVEQLAFLCYWWWVPSRHGTSVEQLVFLCYWWLLPESPRWLLAVGRTREAARVLEAAARRNRLPLPAPGADGPPPSSRPNQAGFRNLVSTPNLRRNSICLFCCWFLAGLNFFGLSQVMGRLGDDIFVTVTLSGVIGLPGILLSLYFVRFGRRRAIIISQLTAGIACLLVTIVPKGEFRGDWPLVALSALALTSMSVLFPAVYLLSGELFPTVVRNAGMGAASMFSRLGSVLAPFVKSLGAHGDYLPMLVLGVSMLAGAATVLPLPETQGCQLPDSIQDGEKVGKRNEDDERNANYLPLAAGPPPAAGDC